MNNVTNNNFYPENYHLEGQLVSAPSPIRPEYDELSFEAPSIILQTPTALEAPIVKKQLTFNASTNFYPENYHLEGQMISCPSPVRPEYDEPSFEAPSIILETSTISEIPSSKKQATFKRAPIILNSKSVNLQTILKEKFGIKYVPMAEAIKDSKRRMDQCLADSQKPKEVKRARLETSNQIIIEENIVEEKIEIEPKTDLDFFHLATNKAASNLESDKKEALALFVKASEMTTDANLQLAAYVKLVIVYQDLNDFEKALVVLREMAKLPLGGAAFNEIGLIYLEGRGNVAKDEEWALRYFKLGAESNDVEAHLNIAKVHDERRILSTTDKYRNSHKQLAMEAYKEIAAFKNAPEYSSLAEVSLCYLKFLNKKGHFSPTDLNQAKSDLAKLSKTDTTNDSRNSLMRALVHYLISVQNKKKPSHEFTLFLEDAASKGSFAAQDLLFQDLTTQEGKIVFDLIISKLLKEPQFIYTNLPYEL